MGPVSLVLSELPPGAAAESGGVHGYSWERWAHIAPVFPAPIIGEPVQLGVHLSLRPLPWWVTNSEARTWAEHAGSRNYSYLK